MNRKLFLIVPLMLVALMVSAPPVRANSTVYFENFQGTSFTNVWQAANQTTQSYNVNGGAYVFGGYLTLVDSSPSTNAKPNGIVIAASQGPALVDSNFQDGALRVVTWRVQPFNFSVGSIGNTANPKNAELFFGMGQPSVAGFVTGFDLVESDCSKCAGNTVNGQLGGTGQKSSVNFVIMRSPNGNTLTCLDSSFVITQPVPNPCSGGSYPAADYTNPAAPGINLNAWHVFTMAFRLFPVGFNGNCPPNNCSWIAWKVDNFQWENVTQASCSCIDSLSGSYSTNYLEIQQAYCFGTASAGGGSNVLCNTTPPTVSVESLFNYVLVTDYFPTTLPNGQLISPTTTPPTVNPAVTSCGGLLSGDCNIPITSIYQYSAGILGTGNIYVGGSILWVAELVSLFILARFAKIKIMMNGFVLFCVVGFVLLMNFFMGVIPFWEVAIPLVVFGGAFFGVFRGRMDIGGSDEE